MYFAATVRPANTSHAATRSSKNIHTHFSQRSLAKKTPVLMAEFSATSDCVQSCTYAPADYQRGETCSAPAPCKFDIGTGQSHLQFVIFSSGDQEYCILLLMPVKDSFLKIDTELEVEHKNKLHPRGRPCSRDGRHA